VRSGVVLVFSMALSFVADPQTWAAIDQAALVLALTFDDGEGEVAADSSDNGNDGTLKNGASWGEGKLGDAVQLENTAHVEVADNPSLVLHDTDFTMAIWANFAEKPGVYTFMSHDSGPASEQKWAWWYSGGTVSLLAVFGINNQWARSGFWEPELHRWYHLAIVRQGDLFTHYRDGEPFGETTKPAMMPDAPAHQLTVGYSEHNYYFQGLLDEALIVRSPFAGEEVRRHMSGGTARILAVQPDGKLSTTWAALRARH